MRTNTRAGDGVRTHDNDVGNVVLYQLSYTRYSVPALTRGRENPRVEGRQNYKSQTLMCKGNRRAFPSVKRMRLEASIGKHIRSRWVAEVGGSGAIIVLRL